jgi:hypothetical protein
MTSKGYQQLTTAEKFALADECERTAKGYPEGHPQRDKIDAQVKELRGDRHA